MLYIALMHNGYLKTRRQEISFPTDNEATFNLKRNEKISVCKVFRDKFRTLRQPRYSRRRS